MSTPFTKAKKIYLGKSGIHGKGIFAKKDIKKDERICHIEGKRVTQFSKTEKEALSIPNWFGMSRKIWIDPEGTIFRYLNHSCSPNAAVIGTRTLVAMRDMRKDEEVVIDYSMTDADPLWHMNCLCKSEVCRKKIYSIHSLPTAVFAKHMPYIPRYFQRIYFRNYIKSKVESRHGGRKR